MNGHIDRRVLRELRPSATTPLREVVVREPGESVEVMCLQEPMSPCLHRRESWHDCPSTCPKLAEVGVATYFG